tara:strand:+ start:579 stop:1031 length:453 start_codon:yes stop_codon:yes gene_type:complete
MTIKIERLSIYQEKLKVTDFNEFVFRQRKDQFVQNPFREIFAFKVILVIVLGVIFQNFGIFDKSAKAQMDDDYSQLACQEFLEPTNPAELKQLRECSKKLHEAKVKVRKEEIRVLRTASASFLSESLGGPSGEIRPADNRDDFNAPAASQ